MNNPISPQVKTALHKIRALADAIKEVKEIPSGTLYAACMEKISLNEYNRIIGLLVRSGLIENKNNLLKWKLIQL